MQIEGNEYIVLERKENNKYLVMAAKNVAEKVFQDYCQYHVETETQLRHDGQCSNIYDGSKIDKYLEQFWYSQLSSTMKAAIQETIIQQEAFDSSLIKQKDEFLVHIVRHVFLPGLDEIMKTISFLYCSFEQYGTISLKDNEIFREFLNNENIWTRDIYVWNSDKSVKGQQILYLNAKKGDIFASAVQSTNGVRPAFVIDLSQVDYDIIENIFEY